MRTIAALCMVAALAAAQEAANSVVGVQARRQVAMRGRTVNALSRAVGVVIGKDGLVLTAALGENAENIRVFRPGSSDPIEAEILDGDDTFTILRAPGLDAPPLAFRRDWKPAQGESIQWLGLLAGPLGKWAAITKPAQVDALLDDEGGAHVLAYSDPPFSGPVTAACALILDAKGRAIGLMLARQQETPGGGGGRRFGQRAVSLPVVRPASVFAHYLSGEVGARGVLGITGEPLGEKVAEAMGLAGTRGVLVTQVTPGSGAAEAGVRPQDVITRVAGTPTPTLAALQQALRGKGAEDEVDVELVRLTETGSQKRSLKAMLTAKESSDKSQRLRAKRFGFVVEPLTFDIRRQHGLEADVKGLHVRRVTPGSPAALARPTPLKRGDIILKVGETAVADVDQLRAVLEKIADGEQATLFVRNEKQTRFVDIRPEAAADD